MPCTTILVGKAVSFDGSTLVARNEDSGAGGYMPKKFVVVKPDEQPRLYRSVLSHVEIPLPEDPMQYTAFPNAVEEEGIWAACGVNTVNVSMTATETITTNERVLAADPLVRLVPAKGKQGDADYVPEQPGGIGEEDMVSLVLPYIRSAREGVQRLGMLLETYGTYEMNAIAFQDESEIWWLETIGGHHYIARRVPDDCYVVAPNQLGIDYFDLDDAFGAQKESLCSADLREFIAAHHLNLSLDGALNPRDAFGSHSDADHVYNTPRAWIVQKYFNAYSSVWEGELAEFRPDSNDIPWCRVPDRKITVEDIKYALSNHFQGTDYDPYSRHADPAKKGAFRPIGVNRTNFLALVQLRPHQLAAIKSLEWIALGSNVFNALIPFYSNVDSTPGYLSDTCGQVHTDSLYWANRLIAALADPYYSDCVAHVERYQMAAQSKALEIIKGYDQKISAQKLSMEQAKPLCAEANAAVADMLKQATYELLQKLLYESSNRMKNGFSRSDA